MIAKENAAAHWAYIEQVLKMDKVPSEWRTVIGFHCQTAFIHGYKHGQEDLQQGAVNGA